MSKTKTCPLCGVVRWASDGKIVLDCQDLSTFRLNGYDFKELLDAVRFAKTNGWKV